MPRRTKLEMEPKFNRFREGDRVMTLENDHCVFEVVEVLMTQPQATGNYLYKCKLVNAPWKERKRYHYHEQQLRPGPQQVRSLVDGQDLAR